MTIPKYARIEFERRFLVDTQAEWRNGIEPYSKRLEDRYLSCGRLRLRRMQDSDTGKVTFKLTKKYESDSPFAQPIVTTLLSEPEFKAFSTLAGFALTKTRHYHEWNGVIFSIDVFEGELSGLVLCETEQADSLDQLRAIRFPNYARWEVTENQFFTGGQLCRAARTQMIHEVNAAAQQ